MRDIVVLLPKKLNAVVETIPFLHQLTKKYKEHNLHIISHKESDFLVDVLCEKFFVHLLPEEKYNMAGIHHFAVNTHMVHDVEIFFDFEGSVKSGVLALSYSAQKKVGYASGLNKVFYTTALEVEENKRNSESHLKLFSDFLEEEVPRVKVKFDMPEDLVTTTEDLFKTAEPAPFIFCHFCNQITEVPDQAYELLDRFDEQLFVHWLPEENYKKELFKDFSPCNRHILHGDSSPDKIRRLLYLSIGVITSNPVIALLGSALGKKVFLLNKKPSKINFDLFQTPPTLIGMNEKGFTNMHPPDEPSRSIDSVSQVVDLIHTGFQL
ncbi:MAG: hypothetical protein EP319_09360 [Deltaproteobacteria bacterium]|nr:MAG: hypothetical protein EP319_09360 [Deltaproteobacteria bacterium]